MSFRLVTDRAQQFTLLFVAVLEPGDQALGFAERDRTIRTLQRWSPHVSRDVIGIMVDTAHHALRSGMSPDVGVIARELSDILDAAESRQLLADLGRTAQADGHLTPSAALAISEIRAATRRDTPRRPSALRDSAERAATDATRDRDAVRPPDARRP